MIFNKIVKSYLQTSYFVESPMYYDGIFNEQLQNLDYNNKVTKEIIEKYKPFINFKNYTVYRVMDGFDDSRITYLLIKNNLVDAFVEIASKAEHNFCTGVWQRDDQANRGLIRDLILNFIPNYYSSLISDKTANKLGISFYKKLLTDAMNMGYRVTVLNGSHQNEEAYDPSKFDSYWVTTDNDIPTHPTFITSKDILFKIYFS
jgi:hypothetical protein